ncbi:hypothetical protein Aperf_G00000095382 [Anoplocephala perfoliata]
MSKDVSSCQICSKVLASQYANPFGCSHCFHTDCLQRWVHDYKVDEQCKCPLEVCSNSFTTILVREKPNDEFQRCIFVNEDKKCPICWDILQTPIALPNVCSHTFCYSCLQKYCNTSNDNSCPVCRRNFQEIRIYQTDGGPILFQKVLPQSIEAAAHSDISASEGSELSNTGSRDRSLECKFCLGEISSGEVVFCRGEEEQASLCLVSWDATDFSSF